jgi:uncharacterized RDD family membrane protein YckC
MNTLALNLAGSWRRFFARGLDFFLECFLIGLLGELTLGKSFSWYVELSSNPSNQYLYGILLTPFALALDSLIIHFFGSTPGKALLGITVRKIKGTPTLSEWLKRGLGLWVYAYALGFPLVSLWTLKTQKDRVDELKQTSYDEKLGFQVFSSEVSKLRFVAACLLLVFTYFISSYYQIKSNDSISGQSTISSYGWQNPITKNEAVIKSIWKNNSSENSDGQKIYTFTEVNDRALVVFARESSSISLSSYRDLFMKANSNSMRFRDGGRYFEMGDMQVWESTGEMTTIKDSQLKVEVRKIGGAFWRIVIVQAKPYEYSDDKIEELKSVLWQTLRPS